MRVLIRVVPPLLVIGLGLWIGFYPQDWQNWLGFSRADYFKYGTNYAFASGPGPMFLTAAGMSTIITGLWHAHNCHEDGCYRIGKHKVDGTPWCTVHKDKASQLRTEAKLLTEIADGIAKIEALLREKP